MGGIGPLQDVLHHLLELGPRQLHVQMLRAARIGGDEGEIDLRLHDGGELHLGFFGSLAQALQGHLVLGKIDSLILLELVDDPVHQALVDVVPAQMGVAVGGLDFNHSLADFEDGYVESAAAEIKYRNRFILFLVQAIGQCRCRRLVHDADHIQPGDLSGILGRLTLAVVEIGGHRNHGLLHFLTQVFLGRGTHLLQNHRRNLRRRIVPVAHLYMGIPIRGLADFVRDKLDLLLDFRILPPHEPLDGKNGVFRIGDRLTLGNLPDKTLRVLAHRNHRRREPASFRIGYHLGLAAFHDRNYGVRGAQVNSDDLAH